ncbi:BrnT family toxin [Dyadobacter psychrophilus]|uniref:BrnT family toxin n=1 Tax=Dyadobacter psychrophilus TaxID=651661 RepID=UPI0009E4DABC
MAPLKFDWDDGNKKKSVEKHLITNAEAESIFLDPKRKYIISHRANEIRFLCIGKSFSNKILTSYYTIRNGKVRVIGTRVARITERQQYEKE